MLLLNWFENWNDTVSTQNANDIIIKLAPKIPIFINTLFTQEG